MRPTIALASAIVLVGSAQAGAQQDAKPTQQTTATFSVSGMACNICATTVERAAKKLDGVTAATADQPKGTAEVTFDPAKILAEDIARLLTKRTGFKTELKKPAKQ
jgi:copper chaperone CopZ